MRQGEIDNCLVMTNSDRCLFPLRAGGRHHDIAGAAAAFDVFAKLADREPANLEARWLLNLSAMLLGRHPERVPAKHRLSPDLFRSKVAAPRFTDVARAASASAPTAPPAARSSTTSTATACSTSC